MKLIIADNRMPEQAKSILTGMGDVAWFETTGITYPAISGHPDIFMTQVNDKLIVAPNTPDYLKTLFQEKEINYFEGKREIGNSYPLTAHYNACVDNKLFIHNLQFTDKVLKEIAGNRKMIHVQQGYGRCNCLSLNGKSYICSDRSIEKALIREGENVLFVPADTIQLPGFSHGFIGGTAGITGNTVVFCGSLQYSGNGELLQNFILQNEMNIIELYSGPLIDVGSILFLV